MTKQELLEIDKCFIWVVDKIRVDGVHFRSVLFGSTLQHWLNNRMRIVTTKSISKPNYECVELEQENSVC